MMLLFNLMKKQSLKLWPWTSTRLTGTKKNIQNRSFLFRSKLNSSVASGDYKNVRKIIKTTVIPINKEIGEDLAYLNAFGKMVSFKLSDTLQTLQLKLTDDKGSVQARSCFGDILAPGIQVGTLLLQTCKLQLQTTQKNNIAFQLQKDQHILAVESISLNDYINAAMDLSRIQKRVTEIDNELKHLEQTQATIETNIENLTMKQGKILGGTLVMQNLALAYGTVRSYLCFP